MKFSKVTYLLTFEHQWLYSIATTNVIDKKKLKIAFQLYLDLNSSLTCMVHILHNTF